MHSCRSTGTELVRFSAETRDVLPSRKVPGPTPLYQRPMTWAVGITTTQLALPRSARTAQIRMQAPITPATR